MIVLNVIGLRGMHTHSLDPFIEIDTNAETMVHIIVVQHVCTTAFGNDNSGLRGAPLS